MKIDELNQINRFMLHGGTIRGAAVLVTSEWQKLIAQQSLPDPACSILGQSIASTLLLSSSLKYSGTLALQFQGPHALSLLFAESDNEYCFRGTAAVQAQQNLTTSSHFSDWVSPQHRGMMVLDQNGSLHDKADQFHRSQAQHIHQSVLGLSNNNIPFNTLSDLMTFAMEQSAQIPTQIMLAADTQRLAGIMIQLMPADQNPHSQHFTETQRQSHWETSHIITKTLKTDELLSLSPTDWIHRLFWEQEPQLLDQHPTTFFCPCHENKVQRMIETLDFEEVQSILNEVHHVEVRCEQCGKSYFFSEKTVYGWFKKSNITLH